MFFGLRLIGRLIGFLFRGIILIGAIAAVAGALAYALFDGERYKDRLSQRVLELTGRGLTVNGKAELEMSWPPRIVLNDVRLKNAPWGSRPDMARIRRVEIEINPLRAISGGNSVAQVRVEGADVLLETNPQGLSNWEIGGLAAGGSAGTLGVLNALGLIGATSTPASLIAQTPPSPLSPPSPSPSPPPSPLPSPAPSPAPAPPRSPPQAVPPSAPLSSLPKSAPPSGPSSPTPRPSSSPPPPAPSASPPSIIVSNPNITIRDGRTGREQIIALGAAIEFTGAAAARSHVVAAANSDDTNPCDGTLRHDGRPLGRP